MNIPFSPPDIGESEIAEVIKTLESGWITTGPRVKELEKKIKNYVNADGCVCLNSQTSCAEMTLRLLGVGPGDEVITTAYTYTATAAVINHVGAKIVLIDTQPNSYEMDYELLAAAITEKTKVIIPVDLGGVPCDYNKIFAIVNNKKNMFHPNNNLQEAFGRIIIMADTAHALGASYCGKMVGSIADFSNFSFHAVKNLTTAEGGAVTWKTIPGIDNQDIYTQYQLLSLHGQSKDAFTKSQLGSWEYDVMGTYYKCNMTDIAAAIGLQQLNRYSDLLDKRQQFINIYDTELKDANLLILSHKSKQTISSGHLYMIQIPEITVELRNEIIYQMAQKGVSCNVHYKPLPLLTAYKNLGFNIHDFPNAYNNYSKEISLPLHTKLSNNDIEYVTKCLKESINAHTPMG